MKIIEPIYRHHMAARGRMLLQATQSCNWNECNFCYRAKDYKFQAATPQELEAQLMAQLPYYPPDTHIFFVGSNTFALRASMLLEYLQVINQYLPEHGRISMFSRIDAIASKSDTELKELKNAGLTDLFVRTENGNNAALSLMNKGHTAEEAIIQLERLYMAGIGYVAS